MPGFECFGEAERKSVQEVLDSGVLMRYGFDAMRSGHWKARELELALAQRMEVDHAHLVSSGTAALTVALASSGIGSGDEVIVPTFTFVASFEAILAVGASPILCDINATLGLDPLAVETVITPKTRAIMAVHMCGSMADLTALKKIAKKYHLVLIEDACQAIGGTFNGRPLGSIGDIGCFSFDYVKTITCGEGGGLITNSSDIYDKAQAFSDHGHDHLGMDRGADEHPHLGYNYRISELNAAVGLAQLKRLDEFLAIQKRNYIQLREALSNLPEVEFRHVPVGGVENYSFLNFFLPNAKMTQQVNRILTENSIDGAFYWFNNNWHYHRKWEHLKELSSPFKFSDEIKSNALSQETRSFKDSDKWMERTLSLLIKLSWTEQELERRCTVLQNLKKHL
ncbi:DegT/DnrJ/EryC1/StrS family aminotransferase [Robiginitalea sp.]|nr:DegT/DnrJ/EryC1/StrS family aminotransferase [Robiginitalea sp.]